MSVVKKVRTLFDVAKAYRQKHPNDPFADEYMKSASDFAKDIKVIKVKGVKKDERKNGKV